MEKTYKIDRKTASKLLKVSTRTVDRYIKSKKLSTRIVDRHIWLSEEEIRDFKRMEGAAVAVDTVDMSTPEMSIDNDVSSRQNFVYSVSTQKKKKNEGNPIYKKLFLDLKEELNEKQERLEIANYRVGQLEAQLRNSIPLLQYHRESAKKDKEDKKTKKKLKESSTIIKKISLQLRYERTAKRLFLIILLIILALQPLWLLMFYK